MKNTSELIAPAGRFSRLWTRIPLWIRSTLMGFLISTIGIALWLAVAISLPLPWSLVLMAVILVVYWKYFSGSWGPASTRQYRQDCFRHTKLRGRVLKLSILASLLLFVFLNAGLTLTFRLTQFDPEVFKTATYLDALPVYFSWPVIIMASLVAGICEEVGYRGYMQAPLEKKYGPAIAILITSIVFVVIHLHQAWAGGILFQIFIIAVMIGFLAYSSQSLIPGIVAHVLFDIVNFSYWWSNVAGTFNHKPIFASGIDLHFLISLLIVIVSFLLYVVCIRRLIKSGRLAGSK